jgi:F-type H+-transporting ATPase subunit b
MPQLDIATFAPQLVWLAISFILLYVLMAWVGLPRIGKAIAARRARIDGDIEKAQQMKAEAEAVIAAYERALAEARQQAQQTLKETIYHLNARSAEAQRKTAAKLESETGAAEKRIAAAKAAAIANIRDVALDVARAAMQKLAGGAVDDRGTAAAVDAVLRERS